MDITYIPFSFPAVPKVRCLFQTSPGGHSGKNYAGGNISFATKDVPQHVFANRRTLQRAVGCPFSELSQVHGDELVFEPMATPAEGFRHNPELSLPEADGQATSKAGLALMIKTADCQPILLSHKSGDYIMALHVGWRGNRMDFITKAVAGFCETYSVHAQDVLAVRGPSLGPQVAEFVNFQEEWGDAYMPWYTAAEKTMDLWALTRHQLRQSGIPEAQIFGLDLCTYSMQSMFFSYRREKESGRQASLIWIKN